MITNIKSFFLDIYKKRSLIAELTKRDIQQQYTGSYLGFIWVFLQPLLFIGVLYMVFTLGFRGGGHTNSHVPFILYLISGMIAWFFFAQNLSAGCDTIKQFSFLLKRVNIRLSILPIVKLASAMVPHLFFMFLAIALAWYNHFAPSLYTLQLFYYLFASSAFLLGVSWLTSSTNLFVPDVKKTVGIIVQFGFWLTPIFWDLSKIPEQYRWILKLNPAYYIVSGYRDAIIYHRWFWERPYETLYYWTLTLLILYSGITVFKKLRPHFAEVV